MPRKTLKIPHRVEWLQVLDEKGRLDAKLEPQVPDDDLRKLYRTLLLTRRLDERCLHLQRQGRIGTYGPVKGMEATPLATAYCLRKDDWFVPSYRELSAFLWRGWPIGQYILWWGGHEYGNHIPEGVHDLPIAVPIASQCQYAAGIAWGCKLRGEDTVCACFVGDGGTSEGDFHEALNWASVFKAPLIMVVHNNQWAISVPRSRQTASETFAQKAIAYGMDGVQIDGNDILAGIVALREAIEKARAGQGPQLIEAVTYRLAMHTTADDPRKYRSDEEVKKWEEKEPLRRFRKYLMDKGVLDQQTEQQMEAEIRRQIDEGVQWYESFKFDRFEFFRTMYAEQPEDLRRQEAELREYIEKGRPEPTAAAAAE